LTRVEHAENQRKLVSESYQRHNGNITAVAKELSLNRSTVRHHLKKTNLGKKPLFSGSTQGITEHACKLPAKGHVQRYICTSAQNNTKVHEGLWTNLQALATHYNAKILVGTFSYNISAYGKLAVKKGTHKERETDLWFDERIDKYICDERIELAPSLLWCGEMNVSPTADSPLSGLETYAGRKSCIFPHAKIRLKSIATMAGSNPKLLYTSGVCTLRNYIQKKAGLKGELHHCYACLVVEVDSDGNWWVRQVEADKNNRLQDLDVVVDKGVVTTGNSIEAVTFGDIHAISIDKIVHKLSLEIIDKLKPKYVFLHDLIEGASVNHHNYNNPHARFQTYLRGYANVTTELEDTAKVINTYCRSWLKVIVAASNHDQWLLRWLKESDYRYDPINALLFLELQLKVYQSIANNNKAFDLTKEALSKYLDKSIQFLKEDQSFTICHGKIECGQHGHLGVSGAKGSNFSLQKAGKLSNVAHTHSAEIINGLFCAGTSTALRMDYSKGLNSWTNSHIITYSNSKRSIITQFNGKWKA
jgi:hypothetical protein